MALSTSKSPASALGLPIVKGGDEAEQLRVAQEQTRRRLTVVALVIFGLFALAELVKLTSQGATNELGSGVIESKNAYKVPHKVIGRGANVMEDAEAIRFEREPSSRGFRDDKQIVVLLTSGRDAEACARSIMAARDSAFLSSRLHFRVFEEIVVNHDDSCLQVFCDLRPRDCKALLRSKRLRVTRRDVSGALGPSVARHLSESMIETKPFKSDFYLSIDASVEFTKHWDLELIKQWHSIGNDKAILSVAPPAIETKGMNDDLYFLQCTARIHSKDQDAVVDFNPPEPHLLPKFENAASGAAFLHAPVLQSQYSERFHFGLVSSMQSVRSDPHLSHVAVGHEYMRATRFWTNGFDFYAPTKDILYYRYELPLVPHEKGHADAAIQRSSRRIRRLLGLSASTTEESLEESAKYGPGERRSLQAWNEFTAIDPAAAFNVSTTNHFAANCERRLHYVHYQ